MATIFQTFEQWRLSTVIYPAGDYLIALPGNNGYYYFKLANGTTPANRLPYAPNPAPFTQPLADGGITGPSTTTPGNLVTWTSSDGTTVGDGPAITDFATAAQGALADTALQPGDLLTDLSSGAAASGQVPESDGAGGIAWVTPSAGSGITELTGPITAGPGTGSQATTVTPNAIDNTMLAQMPSETFKGNAAATPADPADLTADEASDILDTATDPFVRTSNLPASGDVVGPASSTDGSFSLWDGTTGKLLKDGVLPSTGGNGAADDALVTVYGSQGQLHGSSTAAFGYAVQGTATGFGQAGYFTAVDGRGIDVVSVSGRAASFTTGAEKAIYASNTDAIEPTIHGKQDGAGDIAHFEGPTGGVQIGNDGGSTWTSATGAQTTASNLPVFGALTKGVVPAAGAVPAATNFLTETGTFAVPAGTGVPTSRTISTTSPLSGGGDLSANRTLSIPQATSVIDGFLAAADWVIFNAKQAAISFGTGVLTALGVNVGTAGSVVVNGGALGTPSSGTATNLTGTASGLSIGGNAATVTTNANLTGPITSVGNATTIADPELAAIAGLTSAADKTIQYTGSGTAQLVDLNLGTETAYTGTPTFTAGAAPSGASNLRQFYTQIGNLVTWQIMLTYATTGTTVTNLNLTFPTQFPTPAIPTGFTGGSVRIWPCDNLKLLSTPTGTNTNAGLFFIMRNAGNTAFEIASTGTFTSGSYRTFIISGSYFTS